MEALYKKKECIYLDNNEGEKSWREGFPAVLRRAFVSKLNPNVHARKFARDSSTSCATTTKTAAVLPVFQTDLPPLFPRQRIPRNSRWISIDAHPTRLSTSSPRPSFASLRPLVSSRLVSSRLRRTVRDYAMHWITLS